MSMRVHPACFFVIPSEVEGSRHYAKVTPRDSSTTLRSARKDVITYEKNRNTFWTGTEFSARVCRSGESKNRRQRHCRGVCEDRQSDSGRTVRIRCGDRSNFAGRAILSRLAQERRANRHRRGEQSVLVERG